MATQSSGACVKCNIAFALAEKKEQHKDGEYHSHCWAQQREDALRLLIRHSAVPLQIATLRR